jgi:hypothetical protein
MNKWEWRCDNQGGQPAERVQCPLREGCRRRGRCASLETFVVLVSDEKPVEFAGRKVKRHRRGGHS